jgi:hypothetical protein
MKLTSALFAIVGLLAALPAVSQVNTPNKFTPQKYCSSSDTSLECVGRRNQENIDRYVDKYKDEVRQQREKQDAERLERDRQRTVQQKDCNPRVQRCD